MASKKYVADVAFEVVGPWEDFSDIPYMFLIDAMKRRAVSLQDEPEREAFGEVDCTDVSTPEERYLSNPSNCPYCGGGNIVGGSIDIDAGRAYQKVRCEECHRDWHDEYSLTGIVEGDK